MKVRTKIQAGGSSMQHNETLVRDGGLKVRTGVKAGSARKR